MKKALNNFRIFSQEEKEKIIKSVLIQFNNQCSCNQETDLEKMCRFCRESYYYPANQSFYMELTSEN